MEPWIEGLWGALEIVMEKVEGAVDGSNKGADDIKIENTVSDKMTAGDSLTASLSSLSLSPLTLPPCPKSYISISYSSSSPPTTTTSKPRLPHVFYRPSAPRTGCGWRAAGVCGLVPARARRTPRRGPAARAPGSRCPRPPRDVGSSAHHRANSTPVGVSGLGVS